MLNFIDSKIIISYYYKIKTDYNCKIPYTIKPHLLEMLKFVVVECIELMEYMGAVFAYSFLQLAFFPLAKFPIIASFE